MFLAVTNQKALKLPFASRRVARYVAIDSSLFCLWRGLRRESRLKITTALGKSDMLKSKTSYYLRLKLLPSNVFKAANVTARNAHGHEHTLLDLTADKVFALKGYGLCAPFGVIRYNGFFHKVF